MELLMYVYLTGFAAVCVFYMSVIFSGWESWQEFVRSKEKFARKIKDEKKAFRLSQMADLPSLIGMILLCAFLWPVTVFYLFGNMQGPQK